MKKWVSSNIDNEDIGSLNLKIKDVLSSVPFITITPSLASLDIFFDALETPFILKISTALSKSPLDSLIAMLQSLKPAPVISLNFFTLSSILF